MSGGGFPHPGPRRRAATPGPDRRRNWANTLLVLAALALMLAIASVAESVTRPASSAAICQVFSPCGPALRVAACESTGWRPGQPLRFNRRAVGSAGERGLFQIHPVHFGWVNEARLFEPLYNARIASRLSRGGRDWGAWACRP